MFSVGSADFVFFAEIKYRRSLLGAKFLIVSNKSMWVSKYPEFYD
jgi:hypothetical protein